jgi:hypothetical protein
MRRGARTTARLLAALAVLGVAGVLAAGVAGPAAAGSAGLRAAFSATDDAAAANPRASAKDFLSWDWRHCAQILADLQAAPPQGQPMVILLGGSAARECTVSDADWQSQVARRAARTGEFAAPMDVATYNLGSKHRTFALDLAMVGALPKDVPTILYIGVNLGEFCSGWSSTTFSLPPAVAQPQSYNQHIYSIHKRVQSLAAKRRYVKHWMQLRWPNFRARSASNLARLEAVLEACQGTQLHPVLLDLPRDVPAIGRAFDAPIDLYHLRCAQLAGKYGVPWIDFISAAHFVNSDFFDIFHTVEPGRAKYQRLLSDTTIALLAKYGMTPAPTPTPTPTPTDTTTPTPTPSDSGTPAPTPCRPGAAAPEPGRALRSRSSPARAFRSTSGGSPRRATTPQRRSPA